MFRPPSTAQRAPKIPRRGGFTMVELLLAITILLVGAAGVLSAVVTTTNLNRGNREMTLANDAAQSLLERMRVTAFADLYRTFNGAPGDDPGGAGTAAGNTFAVLGLTPRPGDADGFVGSIAFPEFANQVRENIGDVGLGMPRDLDLDGVTDALDHTADYRVIPVRIRVEWTGAGGNREIEIVTVLGGP